MSEKRHSGGILSESESKEMQDLVMPFLEVQKAYEVLPNKKKRKKYDKNGDEEKNTAKSDDLFADYIRKQPYDFLYQSILAGNLESVRTVVEKFSVDINIKYDYIYIGITPINYAIKEDHEQIVDYLINKGAKVSLIDALRLAIKLNSYKTAGLLLGKLDVNDINVQDSDGNTTFHYFFKYFNNPNSDDFVLKRTSFNFDAFNFGQPSSKKSSSKNSSNPNVQKDTQDNNISYNTNPHKDMIKLFDQLQSKMNSKEFREGCARESVIISLKNAISLFHSLVDKGVCYNIPNSERITPLDLCVDQLVDNHRKVSSWDDSIFYHDYVETEKAYYSMINIFVEKGITGLKDGNGTPISHKIVEHNIYPHVENKANIDLMEEDSGGKNALVKGCCDVSTIESLIENGVDLNTPDSLGQTLLHYVVSEYCNSVEEVGYSFQLEKV
nr:ankyrin repeat domain-containing protein [Wolbachia endosymbiont of Oedothorax gibbosus]